MTFVWDLSPPRTACLLRCRPQQSKSHPLWTLPSPSQVGAAAAPCTVNVAVPLGFGLHDTNCRASYLPACPLLIGQCTNNTQQHKNLIFTKVFIGLTVSVCKFDRKCEQIQLDMQDTLCSRHGTLGNAGAVRLYVVLDTSVLLSHWSFIQALHRNLGQDGAVRPDQASSLAPAVQLLLVVPWAVLVELDKLKAERSVFRLQGMSAYLLPAPKAAALMICHHVLHGCCLLDRRHWRRVYI